MDSRCVSPIPSELQRCPPFPLGRGLCSSGRRVVASVGSLPVTMRRRRKRLEMREQRALLRPRVGTWPPGPPSIEFVTRWAATPFARKTCALFLGSRKFFAIWVMSHRVIWLHLPPGSLSPDNHAAGLQYPPLGMPRT